MYSLEDMINMEEDTARERGLAFTPREIATQTDYWPDTLDRIAENRKELSKILNTLTTKKDQMGRLIFSGAGTSEFVGHSVVNLFRRNHLFTTMACPTTEITTHPEYFFSPEVPTVLVSIARSGNSPESAATFDLADILCEQIAHIVITCNDEGKLANKARTHDNAEVVLLHPETNDRGLAMTASFSNMLIACQALSYLEDIDSYRESLNKLIALAERQFSFEKDIRKTAGLDFDRAVYLGNGNLKGIARESALKLQELTDGRVMTTFDSFLGFRHGPEAVVNSRTLITYFLSGNPHVRRYESDLIREISQKKLGNHAVAVGQGLKDLGDHVDLALDLDPEVKTEISDELIGPAQVLFGQLLGLFKALNVGTRPDSPSDRGAIHRVVQGVKIYPYR